MQGARFFIDFKTFRYNNFIHFFVGECFIITDLSMNKTKKNSI